MASKTYTVECTSRGGQRVTFKMHNAGNVNKEELAEAAESQLRNKGVPKHLCKIETVK